MKIWKRSGSTIKPWGTPFVKTAHELRNNNGGGGGDDDDDDDDDDYDDDDDDGDDDDNDSYDNDDEDNDKSDWCCVQFVNRDLMGRRCCVF